MKQAVIAVVLAAVASVLAHLHVVAQTYYPVVRVESPDGLTFLAVNEPTSERRACGDANDRFLEPFKALCKDCRVVLARCERELDGLPLALSEGLEIPAAYRILAPGIRVALTGPADLARAGCDYIAKGLTAQGKRSIACVYPS